MKKCHLRWDALTLKGLMALVLLAGTCALSSCKDDDGLTAGDPNYFTTSRGQFTATLDDNTTLYLLPVTTSGTAMLTYDGSNPRHWQSETSATAISLPDGLTTIGERAFFDCSKLTEITIPASVTTIGDRCFGGRSATDRSKIAAYHVKATTPPTLEGVLYEAQDGVSPVIYVPAGTGAAYLAADGWSELTIVEE